MQVKPLHAAPVAQAFVQLPQCFGSDDRSAQNVLQSSGLGARHRQVPDEQVAPVLQTLVQLPQCSGSDDVFTHAVGLAVGQAVGNVLGHPQVPLEHSSLASVQAWPHVPQLETSVRTFTHAVPHCVP